MSPFFLYLIMIYSEVNCPIIIEKFKHHEYHKDDILKLVCSEPLSKLSYEDDLISLSDWDFHNKESRYSKYFLQLARSTINQLIMSIHEFEWVSAMSIDNVWCQRYKKNDKHLWHHHGKSTMAFVYYLELPEGAPGTEFMNPITKETHQPPVKEGDIIMFPGFLHHRSPVNQSEEIKTIIAFNASYTN
jgi:hypothetical protein